MPKYSQLQRQVLSLYKEFMRAAVNKPGVQNHIHNEFKKNAKIKKADVMQAEYLLRRGKRQLEQLKSGSISSMGVFSDRSENKSSL